jgi:phosphohistidine phosphatase
LIPRKHIKSCDDSIESLIIFLHNAAMTNFVNKFGDVLSVMFPQVVSLQFDTDYWEKIKKGKTKK